MTSSYGSTIYAFDSVKEVVESCNGRLYRPLEEDRTGLRLKDWPAVVEAIDKPWKHGLEAVDRFTAELEGKELPELKRITRRIRFDEADGDELDLDRLRAGQPYWRVSTRESTVGIAEVTIVTDVSADKHVSPTDILWRGAAAIAMAKVLEDRGYAVTLWMTRASCPYEGGTNGQADEWQRVVIAVCLKQAGDRLDVSSLVNAVSAWFYRSVLVTLTRTLAQTSGKRLAQGLGTPERPYSGELDTFSSEVNRLYSMSAFTASAAMTATEWGLRKVKESQEPPVAVETDEDDEPLPSAAAQKPTPPLPPSSKPKKYKPIKVKKVKVPKRATEL